MMTKKADMDFILFNFSGLCYNSIEMMWRGHSHYTMFFTGGICFLILYKVYKTHKDLTFIQRYLVGAGVITLVEFIMGVVFNIILKMGVWDYSDLSFNIWGQVCIVYSMIWGFLGLLIEYLVNRNHRRMKLSPLK